MVYWADVLYEAPLTEAMTGSLLENMSGDSPRANELLDWESRLSPQERFSSNRARKMEPIAQATEPWQLGSAVEPRPASLVRQAAVDGTAAPRRPPLSLQRSAQSA